MPSPRDDADAEADRDPLDPFPTLSSSLRPRTRDPIPTYATIARSPINETRALPAAEGSNSNAGPSSTTNTNGNTNGNGGWSSDDVDRVDSLDEITTFPSSSSHFRSSPPPAPPAPSGPIRRISSDAEPILGSVLSPASTHRPTGTTGAEGMDAYMTGFLANAGHVRDAAVHRWPRRNLAVVELAQALEGTWDEGMEAATRHLNGGNIGGVEPEVPLRTRRRQPGQPTSRGPSRDAQAEDQPANPITAPATDPPTEVAIATIRARLARLRADVGLPPTIQRDGEGRRIMTNAPAAARQIGVPRIIHQRPEDIDVNEDPEVPRDRRQWRFMSTAERADRVSEEHSELRRMRDEGIELVPGPVIRRETDTIDDTLTRARGGMTERAARRQARRQDRETIHDPGLALGPQPGARLEETERFLTAVNRTRRIAGETAALRRIRDNAEMLAYPPGGPGPEDEDEEDFGIWTTVGPDTAATTRRVRPFYAHPNITGDIDIDAWETAFGEDPPPLRRGGNNRRRGNTIRAPLEGHLQRAHGATETRDVRPLEVPNIAGLEPTNIGVNGDIVLVTSRRRERVEEDIQKRADSIKDGKRRKVAEDELKSFSQPKTEWPTYLNHTSLDQVDFFACLPREFESTAETFLRVSYSTIGRPLIKFIDHPQLTGTDADASNIATLQPIPVECGIYYYEVECICEGEEGFMSVGYKVGKRSQNRLVGWDKGTFGWHSDDGMCFEQSGSGSDFAAKWTNTIGVGVDFTTGRAFFTKNGAFIGHRFKNLNSGLRPAFGLRSKGEELCINFTGPFRFDIDTYVETIKSKFAEQVNKVVVDKVPRLEPWGTGVKQTVEDDMMMGMDLEDIEPMHRDGMELDQADKKEEDVAPEPKSDLPVTSVLREPVAQTTAAFVLNYLTQHGYSATLESTRQEMIKRDWISADSPSSSDSQLGHVHQISRQILDLSGPMPLELIDRWCHESELMNRSAVLQLVHLIRQSQARSEDDMEEALTYGKKLREQSRKKGPSDTFSLEWDYASLGWLDEASGSLGLPMTKEQVGVWDERRVLLANKVEASIRCKWGLLSAAIELMSDTHCLEPESKLATSIKQVQVINTVLAPRDPCTTFIDVRQQLGLK